jgi:hypothetical protein
MLPFQGVDGIMDNYPPRWGGLASIALAGRRISRLMPIQP